MVTTRQGLVLDLIAAVNGIARGTTVLVPVSSPDQVDQAQDWCKTSGNSIFAVHEDAVEVYRGSLDDAMATLRPEQMPGYRLWLYTNFHCNLACDYCCVSSSPKAEPWALTADMVAALVATGVRSGVREIYLTGGEPFMNPQIADIVKTCVTAAPTVMLTNAMLLRGNRLEWLKQMPREGLILQISVDSATPDLHDLHRGAGSWQRAIDGISTAKALGFHVRLAATLSTDAAAEELALANLCSSLGLKDSESIVRRVAQQGVATRGIAISRATVVPEVCVTGRGVYWHPVAATDPAMQVHDHLDDLTGAIVSIRDEFLDYRRQGDVLAASFPCA